MFPSTLLGRALRQRCNVVSNIVLRPGSQWRALATDNNKPPTTASSTTPNETTTEQEASAPNAPPTIDRRTRREKLQQSLKDMVDVEKHMERRRKL
jgi:hypothetical protein